MVKISLLHPSFGRPDMAYKAMLEWEGTAKHPEFIEYIIGMDDNDPSYKDYHSWFTQHKPLFKRDRLDVGDSRNVIQVLNRLVKQVHYNSGLYVTMGDDIAPIQNWDEELWNLVKDDVFTPKYIVVNDGQNTMDQYSNYLIVNRAFYKKLGFLLCPEYDGCWADVDIYEVAKRIGLIVKAPHLYFEHRHWCVGKGKMDDTYARHNNPESIERNKKIFEARKERNFDL